MRAHPLFFATLLALPLPVSAAQWTLTDVMPISGNMTDKTPAERPTANLNRFGFFSDLSFDPATGTWFALSDRGPGGGVIGYATRVQQLRIPMNPVSGALRGQVAVLRTITFTDRDGRPFNGLNPTLLNGSPNALGRSFDPEGLAIGRDGRLYVADEYGPSLYEFDREGRFVRAFDIPANLVPRQSDGRANYTDGRPTVTNGRQDNRGFEGLSFNASQTKLYGVMQDPLVQEGSGADGRRSRFVRIVEFDVATGRSTRQFAYPLESIETLNAITPGTEDDFTATQQGRSIGLSAIAALSDTEFLVLERDNRGLGVESTPAPLHKRIYRISLRNANDITNISLAGSSALPSGINPVSKTPEVDLLAALNSVRADVPEKLEGLALGPWLRFGGRAVLVGSDNDFSVTQNGSGQQFDVCVNLETGARQQVVIDAGCPSGMTLIPGYLMSFRVR